MAWWLAAVSSAKNILFGKSEGKGVIQQASDVVERWKPSTVKEHEMNIEQTKTEDTSQDSARKMEFATHEDWFNKIVDGLNRLPRPLFALWAFGQLTGLLPVPEHLKDVDPIVLNIIWTIIGFFFGVRTISENLPQLIKVLRGK